MDNILEYKGYYTKIRYVAESGSVRGVIEGIRDYVDFETEDLNRVEEEFHAAVDDYLEFCEEVGKTPDKEYKGQFNVRIDPALHRAIARIADQRGISLNAAVEEAVAAYAAGN